MMENLVCRCVFVFLDAKGCVASVSPLQCSVCVKCQENDEQPALQTKWTLYSSLTWREWYHFSLLEAIYCCLCFCLSPYLSLALSSEVIGSLVAFCLCIRSVSYFKCFILPVCLLHSCQAAAVCWELWIHRTDCSIFSSCIFSDVAWC